jgi:hypothetical protein
LGSGGGGLGSLRAGGSLRLAACGLGRSDLRSVTSLTSRRTRQRSGRAEAWARWGAAAAAWDLFVPVVSFDRLRVDWEGATEEENF